MKKITRLLAVFLTLCFLLPANLLIAVAEEPEPALDAAEEPAIPLIGAAAEPEAIAGAEPAPDVAEGPKPTLDAAEETAIPLIGAAAPADAAAISAAAPSTAGIGIMADDGVRSIDFNEGWKFFLSTRQTVLAGGSGAAGLRANGLLDRGTAAQGYHPDSPLTADVIKNGFDDSGWRTVAVPHDFSVEGARTTDAGMGIFTGFYQGGLGWYRKTFSVPAEWENAKKISIDFEGVYHNSTVYVNGQKAGNYPNGYTGFAYDITDCLDYGSASNVVVVKVEAAGPSARWYSGAGINRPVRLVVAEKTHFVRDGIVMATPSLEADYTSQGIARLTVKAYVRNENAAGFVAINTLVHDASGAKVAEAASPYIAIAKDEEIQLLSEGLATVGPVTLWTLENPYRYTVTNQLLYKQAESGAGAVVDEAAVKYGFRYTKADPARGFFLNGKYTKLHGVNLHSDNGALGIAGTYDAMKRQLSAMKDMGVNAVRTAHNPYSKTFIDLCSEMGFLVCAESFDGWGAAKYSTYDFSVFFLEKVPDGFQGLSALRHTLGDITTNGNDNAMWSDWVQQQMVYRDINEPSVIMYSIGNEVAMSGQGTRPNWFDYDYNDYLLPRDDGYKDMLTAAPYNYTPATFNLFTETLRLRNDVLAADGTRYVVAGTDQSRAIDSANYTNWIPMLLALDGKGFNYFTAASTDHFMETFPDKFFFDSESASAVTSRGAYMPASLPNTPVDNTPGKRYVSGYNNRSSGAQQAAEFTIKKDRDRTNFLGQFIWTGTDYLGEPTPYNSTFPVGSAYFGMVDLAGFPKDIYYAYKSQWNPEPFAHLVPMDWNEHYPGEEVEVWVYTTAPKAELFLNGASLGVKSFDLKQTVDGRPYYETTEPTHDGDPAGSGYFVGAKTDPGNPVGYVSPNGSYGKLHLTWHVPFAPGKLEVKALDGDGNVVAEDSVATAAAARAIKATPHVDRTEPGRRLVYVECDVVDGDGVLLPRADNLITFSVTGNGTIIGVDNGNQDTEELFKWGNVDRSDYSERSAYNGKALVIVETGLGTGPITLTVSSEGLLPTVVTIPTDGGLITSASPALGTAVSIASRTVAASLGKPVTLPKYVSVAYSSGISVDEPVTWDISDSAFATIGAKSVPGRFDNPAISDLEPIILVDVGFPRSRANIGLNPTIGNNSVVHKHTAAITGPLATASFTAGSVTPNNMLNGGAQNWSNYNANVGNSSLVGTVTGLSRPFDWVETYWPSERTFDEARLTFTLNANNGLPSAVFAWYWDGKEYQSVANLASGLVPGTDNVLSITFGPVASSRIRVGMANDTPFTTTGNFTVTSFATMGDDDFADPLASPAAGISSLPRVFKGVGKVNNVISLSNVKSVNLMEARVKVDPAKVSGVDCLTPAIPGFADGFSVLDASYDAGTGEYSCTLALMGSGIGFGTVGPVPVFELDLRLGDSVSAGDVVQSTLVSVTVYDRPESGANSVAVAAIPSPRTAAAAIVDGLFYDINGDGAFDMRDISDVIYFYYGATAAGPRWDEAEGYDVDFDGIVDVLDILLLLSYVAR